MVVSTRAGGARNRPDVGATRVSPSSLAEEGETSPAPYGSRAHDAPGAMSLHDRDAGVATTRCDHRPPEGNAGVAPTSARTDARWSPCPLWLPAICQKLYAAESTSSLASINVVVLNVDALEAVGALRLAIAAGCAGAASVELVEALTSTLSNVEVLAAAALWLLTTMPMNTLLVIETVAAAPTCDHVVPSVER